MVTNICFYLNIKAKHDWALLNYKTFQLQEQFSSILDRRFKNMVKLNQKFKYMNASESTYIGLVM